MASSLSRVRDVFRSRQQPNRCRQRGSFSRPQYAPERLENRAMLAISVAGGGPVSNYLIVGSNEVGGAASDIFIQRRADGELYIADNSSFLPNANFHEAGTPSLLYVTNAEAGLALASLNPGDNRQASEDSPEDFQLSTSTTFSLAHGSIYTATRDITATVSYNGNSWAIRRPSTGPVVITPDNVINAGPEPTAVEFSTGLQTFDVGDLIRGTFTVRWSSPVATVPHSSGATPQPPIIATIDYFADDDTLIDFPELSVSEFDIPVSAEPNPAFLFDVGGNGRIVAGTLTGTIYIDSKRIGGGSTRGFELDFATDITTGQLFFGGRNFGEVDSLRIAGTYSAAGTINLTFTNRYGIGTIDPGARQVSPGPVELQNIRFLQHVTPEEPSTFTLFAGHDLPSQLHVDLNAAGSTINIDSPVIVATVTGPSDTRDIDLRATNVNLNSMVASQDDLFIGSSGITGTPAEIVRLNAAVAAPGTVEINVANDTSNDISGGPLKGELIVSQSGRISGQLQPLTLPFGDPTITPIFVEEEPNGNRAGATENGNLMGSFTRIADETYRASVIGDVRGGIDTDWYRIDTRANDLIVIDMEGSATGAGSHPDPFLYLYGPVLDTPIALDDDSGIGLNARITHRVPAAGPTTLFIVADSFSTRSGSYKLTVTVFREPARPTATLLVDALASNVFVEGTVFATNQSWLMQSDESANTRAPYLLTTKSGATGARTGLLRGDTVAITLGNDADTPLNNSIAYNELDVDTDVRSLRTKASTRLGDSNPLNPFPYRLSVRENDGLLVDAVAASSLPITFASDGDIGFTSSVHTAGGIQIETRRVGSTYGAFQAASEMTTVRGSIGVVARNIIVGNTMAVTDAPLDAAVTDISLNAVDGGIDIGGLLSARNDVSLRQQTPDSKTGRIQGSGRIRARNLRVLADSVGNALVRQTDPLFFLQTEIDSVTGEVGNGFAIRERDDVTVSQLRVPSGLVALVAEGVDGRSGSPNSIALRATGIDVSSLVASTPNGSMNVRIDSGKDLVLGDALAIREGTSVNMVAAGDAIIRSSAGPIRVLDAPVGGGGARQVLYQTKQTLNGTYNGGTPGVFASEISAAHVAVQSAFGDDVASKLQNGNRVLVKDGVGTDSARLHANGVYMVTSQGNQSNQWVFRRATDSDTYAELASGSVVYVTSTQEHRVLSHGISNAGDFGRSDVRVGDPVPRRTEIGSNLPLPNAVVEFVVSSTAGSTMSAGSLGKMINLRQNNDTRSSPNPAQPMRLSFSAILGPQIELVDELPVIRRPLIGEPLIIDANNRFAPPLPAGTTFPQSKLSVTGTLIGQTSVGEPRVTRTVSVRPLRTQEILNLGLDPAVTRRTVVISSQSLAAISVGMTVSSVGVHPGSRVLEKSPSNTTLSSDGTLGTVELSEPLDPDWVDGSRTVTFATEVDGFHFASDATGAAVANIALGGFETGAAIRIEADPRPSPSTTPAVNVTDMRIGQDWSGNRIGNEFGVLVSKQGSALITGSTITSSSGAAIRTQDQASNIVIDGVQIGSDTQFNVVGVELAGTGDVYLGRTGPNSLRNVISSNRVGVIARSGTNRITNTTVTTNSFEGVKIEGGNYQIGDVAARNDASNVILGNGTWGVRIEADISPQNPQSSDPLRRIQGNYFGVNPDGSVRPNGVGNVAIGIAAAGVRSGLRPRASGVDSHENLHGPMPTQPTMYVASPLDNSAADTQDQDHRVVVRGGAALLSEMSFVIEDDGNAVAESSVTAAAFTLQYSPLLEVADAGWNGAGIETMAVGNGIGFRYDANARRVILSSTTGFRPGSYRVVVNNAAPSGVRDGDSNYLLPNGVTGSGLTAFVVVLDANSTGPQPPVGPPQPPVDGSTFEIGPTPDGSTLYVDAVRRESQSILIRNTGDIVVRGAVEAPQSGRIISVISAQGRVIFESSGEFRAGLVSLAAAGDSQLRIGSSSVIQGATVASGGLDVFSSGAVRQSGPITASRLAVTTVGGAIDLVHAGNAVDVFSASASVAGGAVSFVNARSFTIGTPGVVAGTDATIDGQLSLTAQSGNVTVAAPLVALQDVAFVRAPLGTVVVNAGVTNSVRPLIRQDSSGTVVDGGFLVGDVAGLVSAVQLINSLPNGVSYQLVVAASITLDRTLSFTNAVDFQGLNSGVIISGAANVTDGLVVSSSAVGSRITNLAFANFTGTAVTVNAAQNVAIQGLTVSNSATGLALSGVVTGTTVRGSTFRSVRVAMQLTGAQGATIGGTPTAQRNRIEGATQAGVVATGFCTGTRVVGTTFTANPRTRVQFNVKGSRGLRVSGTSVERAPRVTAPSSSTGRAPISIFGRR